MSFAIGIIGLPNVGKSTLFQALTKKQVAIAPFPFTTIDPNVAQIPIPDERLEKISKLIKPEKTTPALIEFIDIAGLVKGAHKGEGLGNQFLSYIQGCKALLEVVRGFENEEVEHPERTINPQRDIEIIKEELLQKDQKIVKKALENCQREVKAGKKEKEKLFLLLEKIAKGLEERKPIRELALTAEELPQIRKYQFLTAKPILYLLNVSSQALKASDFQGEIIDLKWELELSELSEKDLKEIKAQSLLDRIILKCYNLLGLITFYTIAGGKEVRAWIIKKGTKAQRAGREVHSDFEKKFIRAEVLPFQELIRVGSWKEAREKGLIKIVGKDYVVQDGDIIEFKI
jgi:hypothetical protein